MRHACVTVTALALFILLIFVFEFIVWCESCVYDFLVLDANAIQRDMHTIGTWLHSKCHVSGWNAINVITFVPFSQIILIEMNEWICTLHTRTRTAPFLRSKTHLASGFACHLLWARCFTLLTCSPFDSTFCSHLSKLYVLQIELFPKTRAFHTLRAMYQHGLLAFLPISLNACKGISHVWSWTRLSPLNICFVSKLTLICEWNSSSMPPNCLDVSTDNERVKETKMPTNLTSAHFMKQVRAHYAHWILHIMIFFHFWIMSVAACLVSICSMSVQFICENHVHIGII